MAGAPVAIIGGTGFDAPDGFEAGNAGKVDTPYGRTAAPLVHGTLAGVRVLTLQRHGEDRSIAPHRVNYRANLWALRECGARTVVAIAAVGGITPDAAPGCLILPDQVIDYTWGRAHTVCDGEAGALQHVDFTCPYTPSLRAELASAAAAAGVAVVPNGVYAATQGPRLESAAEIVRLERDGCTVVGMTGMPEASLARELGLDYACFAVVVNWAAGKSTETIDMHTIHANMSAGMVAASRVLEQFLQQRTRA